MAFQISKEEETILLYPFGKKKEYSFYTIQNKF